MARRPAQEQGDTLGRIRSEAFSLFGRYGYDGVSMGAVARVAGVTKAALYWHYQGKEALYTDCVRHLAVLFGEHVFDRMRAEPDPAERLMLIFEGLGTLLADERVRQGVAGFWLEPSTADVAEARAVQARFEDASARTIADAITEAVDAGSLSLNIPVEDMAQAVIATMEAIILPLRRNRQGRSQRLIGALAHTFFRAHAHGDELAARAIRAAAVEAVAA